MCARAVQGGVSRATVLAFADRSRSLRASRYDARMVYRRVSSAHLAHSGGAERADARNRELKSCGVGRGTLERVATVRAIHDCSRRATRRRLAVGQTASTGRFCDSGGPHRLEPPPRHQGRAPPVHCLCTHCIHLGPQTTAVITRCSRFCFAARSRAAAAARAARTRSCDGPAAVPCVVDQATCSGVCLAALSEGCLRRWRVRCVGLVCSSP